MIKVYTGITEEKNIRSYLKNKLKVESEKIKFFDNKHPEMQVEDIVKLIEEKEDIYIITFSVYILTALKEYVETSEFYLLNTEGVYEQIPIEQLNIIFRTMSNPLQKLVWAN